MDFEHYQSNQQILAQITRHTTLSIKTLKTKIVQWNNATETEIQADLDLIHFIFKHARACCSSSSSSPSSCAAQILYPQLAQLVIHQTNDGPALLASYSLLRCMVDLVKHDAVFPLSSAQSLLFITTASPLWSHRNIYICRKAMELCYRLLLLSRAFDDNQSVMVDSVIVYIRQCRAHMTRADIEKIRSPDYTEFYFAPVVDETALSFLVDRSTIRWLVHIIFALFLKQVGNDQTLRKEIQDLYNSNRHRDNLKDMLFDICCANDDDTVHLLNTVLSIYQQPQQHNALFLSTLDINPHNLFLFFLQRCGNTHDILVDLLLENDSEFIAYFHRYIIYATQHMDAFKEANRRAELDLDSIQTIIANTLLVLEGDAFPYNAKPLIRRLAIFEEKLFEDGC